jgi:hypothetical protein
VSNAVTKLPAQDPSNLLSSPLGSAGLAEQVELLKITPTILGREEMAWLWTALKADYRPTYPFQVSVVLLQSQHPASSTLPVLTRSIVAQPSILPVITLPTLTAVLPPKGQAAAALDDDVTLTGSNLGIVTDVLLVNPIRQFQRTLAVTGTPPVFTVQNTHSINDPPAGVYQISGQFPGVPGPLNSNSLPFAIAPDISTWSPGIIPSGATTLTVPCKPFVQPGQDVSLIIGNQQAPANPFAVATNTPSFAYANLQQTGGAVPARMRVDGVDSAIIDMTATPPQFNPALMVTVV